MCLFTPVKHRYTTTVQASRCYLLFLSLAVHRFCDVLVISCTIRLTIPALTALISAALREFCSAKQLSVWPVLQSGAALPGCGVSLSGPGRAPRPLHRRLRTFATRASSPEESVYLDTQISKHTYDFGFQNAKIVCYSLCVSFRLSTKCVR